MSYISTGASRTTKEHWVDGDEASINLIKHHLRKFTASRPLHYNLKKAFDKWKLMAEKEREVMLIKEGQKQQRDHKNMSSQIEKRMQKMDYDISTREAASLLNDQYKLLSPILDEERDTVTSSYSKTGLESSSDLKRKGKQDHTPTDDFLVSKNKIDAEEDYAIKPVSKRVRKNLVPNAFGIYKPKNNR